MLSGTTYQNKWQLVLSYLSITIFIYIATNNKIRILFIIMSIPLIDFLKLSFIYFYNLFV